MATKHPSRGTGSLPSFAVEGLEKRQLLASISGAIWNDLDTSRTFDKNEPLLAGWTVFLDANQNRTLDAGEVSTTTAADGGYKFDNVTPGTYTVAEVLQPGYGQTYPGRSGASQSNFTVNVRFTGGLTPTQQAVFNQAAAKWQSVIIGDVPDVLTDIGVVDDIVIDAKGSAIDGVDGTLGQAGPDQLRDGSFLPARATMEFDTADLAALERDGDLYSVILHEMGHALGIGTIWSQTGRLRGFGSPSPTFVGPAATAEFNAIFGRNDPAVPVEANGGGGTAYSHWPEDLFKNELMTGYISGDTQPLSRITAASMQDIGYVVNLDAADPYNPFASGAVRSSANRNPSSRVLPTVPTILPASALVPSAELNILPYAHTVVVTAKKNAVGVLFGNRLNSDPTIGRLLASPADVVIGKNVTLRATAVGDAEGDGIYQVRFYRESNGVAGLQAGDNGDAFIATDSSFAKGGWRVDAPTDEANAGIATFYARAFDELGGSSVRLGRAELFEPQPPPAAPTNTTVSIINGTTTRLTWRDASSNENGFEIQRSSNPGFTGKVFKYAVDENVTSFDISGLNPGELYYYRVRAVNTGGLSGYSAVTSGRNLATGELVIDNNFNRSAVVLKGEWAAESVASGFYRKNYLQDGGSEKSKRKGKAAVFMLDVPIEGEYYVYGQWTQNADANAKAVPYYVTSTVADTEAVIVDQSKRGGGWVLLGTYAFGRGGENSVTISTKGTSGTVVADAIRVLPTTETVDKLRTFYGTGLTGSAVRAAVPAVTSSGPAGSGTAASGSGAASVATEVLADAPRGVFAGLRSKTFREQQAELLG